MANHGKSNYKCYIIKVNIGIKKNSEIKIRSWKKTMKIQKANIINSNLSKYDNDNYNEL